LEESKYEYVLKIGRVKVWISLNKYDQKHNDYNGYLLTNQLNIYNNYLVTIKILIIICIIVYNCSILFWSRTFIK